MFMLTPEENKAFNLFGVGGVLAMLITPKEKEAFKKLALNENSMEEITNSVDFKKLSQRLKDEKAKLVNERLRKKNDNNS